ncbi:MAG TPA: metallophosphoesterase [Pirellulales bacterium]|jgi:predicted phosphodiesterase
MKITFRRVLAIVILLVLCAGIGWGWAVVTPTISEPVDYSSTPGEKLWSFAFVGDTHEGRGITDRIFAKMREANLEFVVHLGDLVDRGDSDEQWEYVLAEAAQNRLRIMPVVGNHDKEKCYDDRGEIRFRQYFSHLPRTFYHFRHRGLNFVMLNSERLPLPGTEQASFLRWQLARHPGPTIVCQHRPVFTSSHRDWANMYLFRLWTHGGIKDSDTTLVLTGHNHYYERSKPLDGITYVVSGGGAPNQYATENPQATSAKLTAGRNHYGLVDVYADHLNVRVLDLEDQLIDTFTVPLATTEHAPGTAGNPSATELPPIESLPAYREERLGLRPGAPTILPRPW